MTYEDAQVLPADEGRLEASVKPLCAHCGFALPASGTGVRHYGTHTAHHENECLRLLHAEIARLTALNQSLRQSTDTAREIMGRCIVGLNKLDRLARDWEPDHSTGADRQLVQAVGAPLRVVAGARNTSRRRVILPRRR